MGVRGAKPGGGRWRGTRTSSGRVPQQAGWSMLPKRCYTARQVSPTWLSSQSSGGIVRV